MTVSVGRASFAVGPLFKRPFQAFPSTRHNSTDFLFYWIIDVCFETSFSADKTMCSDKSKKIGAFAAFSIIPLSLSDRRPSAFFLSLSL